MGQVSETLRRTANGHTHYCPGCHSAHVIPDGWSFDGDVDQPTFSPSVKITYNGKDAGKLRGVDGTRAPYACCHYVLRGGVIEFCADSTHPLTGQRVPLPPLPPFLQDHFVGDDD